jgi:hypothetical protein
MKWLGILVTAALLLMAPGYGNVQPSQGKDTSPAKSYSLQERQAYQQKVAEDLGKLQQRVTDLEDQYLTARPQVKRMLLKSIHSLKMQLAAAQNRLAALQKASAQDWGSFKAKMDKDMKELTQACQEAESRLQ